MSVIQQIRDKYAAAVIAIIALSLIGFIMMDAFVGRGRGAGTPGSAMGKVNGEKIDRNDFEKRITLQQTMYGQQNAQREQLINNVWEQTVDELVMQQEYKKLRLKFTAKELNDVLFGPNAPQWLKSEFTDKQTGEYKVAEAKQYFAQIKKQKDNPQTEMFNEAYIMPTISQGLRMKYMSLLGQSTYVPKWYAEKALADQNAITGFTYVTVPYSTIADSTVKVTDSEVKSYIEKNPQGFKLDYDSRSISFIAFNANPNSEDSATVLNKLVSQADEFRTASDPEIFLARAGSDMPYYDGYVLGSKMQVPNADSIKMLSIGQMFGPYLDGSNFCYAKLIDRRFMPDSVKVRHILIKTGEKGQQTMDDSTAKKRIDSIAGALKTGADFNSLVLQFSDDEGSKSTKGEYEFTSTQFPNLSREFAEVAFYGNTGDKKVVKANNQSYSGYHYIEVMQQKKIEPAYKVAYFAKSIDASQETVNTANNAAAQFAAQNRTRKQFDENAAKENLQVLNAADIKRNDYQIGGLGENRSLIRWIYENKEGNVSEPYEVADKYVVVTITGASEKGLMSVAKARPMAEPFIMNEKKAKQIIANTFKGGATIEAVAQAVAQPVMRADSVSFNQPFIPNIGNEPKITGAAFNASLMGKVSEPIAGNTGVFVIKGETITAAPNFSMTAETLRMQMENQQKQMGGYRSMEALKKAANIKDNRFDFY